MPRIRCFYLDCNFLDDGVCSAAAVQIDPDEGCLTYSPMDADIPDEQEWVSDDDYEEWDITEDSLESLDNDDDDVDEDY